MPWANFQTEPYFGLILSNEYVRRYHFWVQKQLCPNLARHNSKTGQNSALWFQVFDSFKLSTYMSKFSNRILLRFSFEWCISKAFVLKNSLLSNLTRYNSKTTQDFALWFKYSISWSLLLLGANFQTRYSVHLVSTDVYIGRCHFWVKKSLCSI